MGAAPHALGRRVCGPAKDEAMVWETQATTLSPEFLDVVAAATGSAAEQDSIDGGRTTGKIMTIKVRLSSLTRPVGLEAHPPAAGD